MKIMDNRVLMCVPTYNRPDMVKEVLEYELPYYKNYSMDLCYYDSSADNRTARIIEQYTKEGCLNVFLKKMPSELCLDYKLVEILKEAERSQYDYLWLVNDSISITKEALDIVFSMLDDSYDLIRLPLAGDGSLKDLICTDVNKWFQQCSQGMAHMASTVMSASLLKKAPHDWEYLVERYIGSNELGDGHGFFFMVAFFLEQIAKLESFKGIFIGNRVKWRRDSPLKGSQIYWKKYVFQTWAKSYVDTIMLLPEVYTKKKQVIRRSDNLSPGRFSQSMLIRYRLNGLYSLRIFFQYKKYLPFVTNVPIHKCMVLSCLPVFLLKIVYGKNNIEESMWSERLEEIVKKIGDRPVIVYGAGLYGERVVKELKKGEKKSQIIGIAVTNHSNNVSSIEGVRVYEMRELLEYRKKAAVIIAALPDAACSIRKGLKANKFKRYYALLGY